MDPDGDRAAPPPARGHLHFPSTSWDLLAHATRRGEESASALNELAERYYAAVRAYITAITRDAVDADDMTQQFFQKVILNGQLLKQADPVKGSFRPYLKQAIRNFLVDEYRREARTVKTDVRPDALDEGWSKIADSSPGQDQEMLRAWAQSLVGMAVARLEALCRDNHQDQHFAMFSRRYVANPDDPPSWRQVGEAFGLDEKIARSRAETAARHFRTILRQLIASDVGSSEDVYTELQSVIALL